MGGLALARKAHLYTLEAMGRIPDISEVMHPPVIPHACPVVSPLAAPPPSSLRPLQVIELVFSSAEPPSDSAGAGAGAGTARGDGSDDSSGSKGKGSTVPSSGSQIRGTVAQTLQTLGSTSGADHRARSLKSKTPAFNIFFLDDQRNPAILAFLRAVWGAVRAITCYFPPQLLPLLHDEDAITAITSTPQAQGQGQPQGQGQGQDGQAGVLARPRTAAEAHTASYRAMCALTGSPAQLALLQYLEDMLQHIPRLPDLQGPGDRTQGTEGTRGVEEEKEVGGVGAREERSPSNMLHAEDFLQQSLCFRFSDIPWARPYPRLLPRDTATLSPIFMFSPHFKEMDVSHLQMSETVAVDLFQALAMNDGFTQLKAQDLHLKGSKLGRALKLPRGIRVLDLSHNPLTSGAAQVLSDLLYGQATDAIFDHFEDQQTHHRSSNMQSARSMMLEGMGMAHNELCCFGPILRVLDLENCKLDGSFARLAAVLALPSCACSLLQLNISHNRLGVKGSEALGTYLAQATVLEVLNVANCGLDCKTVYRGLAQNTDLLQRLQHLDGSFNSTDTLAMDNLQQFLQRTSALGSIALCSTSLGTEALELLLGAIFVNRSPGYELALDLSLNRLDVDCARVVAKEIAHSVTFPLRKLVVNDCSLGPEGVKLIVEALVLGPLSRRVGYPTTPFSTLHNALRMPMNAQCKLQVLSLERNIRLGMFSSEGPQIAMTSLASLMKSNVPLVAMSLKGSAAAHLKDHMVPLVQALKDNKTLTYLNIANNRGRDALAVAVGHMLRTNQKVGRVSL